MELFFRAFAGPLQDDMRGGEQHQGHAEHRHGVESLGKDQPIDSSGEKDLAEAHHRHPRGRSGSESPGEAQLPSRCREAHSRQIPWNISSPYGAFGIFPWKNPERGDTDHRGHG